MTRVRIHVNIPSSGVAALNRAGGAVYEGMDAHGRTIRDFAVEEITRMRASVSGDMRQALAWETRSDDVDGVTVRVGVDLAKTEGDVDYPLIVHEGRGPIHRRRVRALRFEPKDARGRVAYATRVGPADPKPFLTNALDRFQTGV